MSSLFAYFGRAEANFFGTGFARPSDGRAMGRGGLDRTGWCRFFFNTGLTLRYGNGESKHPAEWPPGGGRLEISRT